MTVFFDTSALVKLYHDEKGTSVLIRFVEKNRAGLISED